MVISTLHTGEMKLAGNEGMWSSMETGTGGAVLGSWGPSYKVSSGEGAAICTLPVCCGWQYLLEGVSSASCRHCLRICKFQASPTLLHPLQATQPHSSSPFSFPFWPKKPSGLPAIRSNYKISDCPEMLRGGKNMLPSEKSRWIKIGIFIDYIGQKPLWHHWEGAKNWNLVQLGRERHLLCIPHPFFL